MPRSQSKIEILDDLPYKIASNVLGQGVQCDALAQHIRATLPGYLHILNELARKDFDTWMKQSSCSWSEQGAIGG